MPAMLWLKNVPDDLMLRLLERAERHQQSFQNEVLAILRAGLNEDHGDIPGDVLTAVRGLGLNTPYEAVEIIRTDRGC